MSPWTTTPIQARQVTRHADFNLATIPNRNGGGFIAWAKMGEIRGTNPLDEPGRPVWFEFGSTRDEARDKLLGELGLHGFER